MKRHIPAAMAIVVLTIGLAGCAADKKNPAPPAGSAPATAPSQPGAPSSRVPDAGAQSSDVCKIVPIADVAAVVHKQLSTAKPDLKAGERICDYDNSEGTAGISIGLSDTTSDRFDSDAQSYPPVEGVGDGAFDDSVILYVRHDDTKISISAGGGDEVRIPLARTVIARLVIATSSPSPSATGGT